MSEEFKAGDVVEPSSEYLRQFRGNRFKGRRGVISKVMEDSGVLHVLWDGRRSIDHLRPEFVVLRINPSPVTASE